MSQSPLRILVVLPMYGGSLPIGRYCAKALESLGHTVRLFDASFFYPTFNGLHNLGLSPAQGVQLERSFLQVVGQAIWAQAQSLEPHLVLAMAQAPVSRTLLQRFTRAGVRTAMWFVEDHLVFNYWRDYAPLYDVFAVIQKEPFLSMLAALGQKRVMYLPLAALPEFHQPLALSPAERREYGADISFLGAGYPNRRLAFRPLAGRNFKIWGSDWEGESLLAAHVQRQGARISEEESVRVYNATTINLNLHSSIQDGDLVSHGDFVNPRTFELAAMGAFQLVDRRTLMDGLFAADELAIIDSIEELYSAIDFYLVHPEERRTISARSRSRVLREHTYEKRMLSLLTYMEAALGPWRTAEPEQTDRQTSDDALDPVLREALARLLRKLGLGNQASLDDVLTRLRQQTGALDELEASLLFLDAWRRQYL
ncbi:MAG: glycosyltransferase [Desulfovibrio sp.]|nr:glycosyltransferase [Desulfovibrio sp.]